jgi:hypothetical protein
MWYSIGQYIHDMDLAGDSESPIERTMFIALRRSLVPAVKIDLQHDIETLCGWFRIDMLLNCRGLKIGIECDGKDFRQRPLPKGSGLSLHSEIRAHHQARL